MKASAATVNNETILLVVDIFIEDLS